MPFDTKVTPIRNKNASNCFEAFLYFTFKYDGKQHFVIYYE